jgi:hypothetical protein
MDAHLEDKLNAEIEKLNFYLQTCRDGLNDHSAHHPYRLAEYEKEKIMVLLNRLFDGEIEFLAQSPEDYFNLYEDE